MAHGAFTRRAAARGGAALLGALAVACGGPPAGSDGGGAQSRPPAEVEFSNSTSAGDPTREGNWDTLIAGFTQAHPWITVKKQYVRDTEYYDKMVVEAAAGTLPDVVSNRSDKMESWAAGGMLLPLDDLVGRKDFRFDDFSAEAKKIGQFKGRTLGVPRQLSVYVLYYNKDLFDKAGVPYPDARLTWSSLLDAAKRLTTDTTGDGKADQWGYLITANIKMWLTLMWSNGGDYMDRNKTVSTVQTREATEAVQQYLDLIHVHRVAPTATELPQTGNAGFQTGSVGMYVALEGYVNTMRQRAIFGWDVAPVPAGRAARATPFEAGLYCLAATTRVKEDAFRLLSHMVSTESQDFYARQGTFPSRQSSLKTFAESGGGQPPANLAVVAETAARYARYWPVTTTWDELSKEWNTIMDKALRGEATATQAHAELKPVFDRLLQEHQRLMK
jgi:multiple sugar transport system substrate-binding protein